LRSGIKIFPKLKNKKKIHRKKTIKNNKKFKLEGTNKNGSNNIMDFGKV